ncbi:aldose epimerase family protein [Thermosipho atlanticus]|uniref:Aldose 1-epimerase n=1 Tax=Thermosipho atlanticus DSM 15807 TaxID=1123380 RepID=A0A1M5S2M0_9BACT|nr:aldose epimerase family protein [Thermosipho atlanticus]SHH32892.1 aldose 1-epimerase [Thermosipho atlanticus DSM 15807]
MNKHTFGKVKKEFYGKTSKGISIFQYSLINAQGLIVKIINYGGIITNILIPNKFGKYQDIVLGFDTIEEYEKYNSKYFFGAIVGRYANRIAYGRFTIKGITYQLQLNDNGRPNSLHGGINGFHTKVFKASSHLTPEGPKLILKYRSPDGEEGFPGNLDIMTIYQLTNNNELSIDFYATTDKPTIVNFTQHSYFNLSGIGNIYNHLLQINANFYTPLNENLIPTGEIQSVKNTIYDFTTPIKLEEILKKKNYEYDINFVLNTSKHQPSLAARLQSLETGITLELYTTLPGLQLYTGNYLDNVKGKYGTIYKKHFGICLEPQFFPDSPNHPNFPNTILEPNEFFHHKIVYKFIFK